MKRLVAVLMAVVLLIGSVSALAGEEQIQAMLNVAKSCLTYAENYLKAYKKSETKPDEYLAQAYHFYCIYRDIVAASTLETVLDIGTGVTDVHKLEGTLATESDEILDTLFKKWVEEPSYAEDVALVLDLILFFDASTETEKK